MDTYITLLGLQRHEPPTKEEQHNAWVALVNGGRDARLREIGDGDDDARRQICHAARVLGHFEMCQVYLQMHTKDYYAVLGLPNEPEDADVSRAYRRLAMQLHPDRRATRLKNDPAIDASWLNDALQQATADFQMVTKAYQTLKTGPLRREYDLSRADAFCGGGGSGGGGGGGGGSFGGMTADEVFHQVFGRFFGPNGVFQRDDDDDDEGWDIDEDGGETIGDDTTDEEEYRAAARAAADAAASRAPPGRQAERRSKVQRRRFNQHLLRGQMREQRRKAASSQASAFGAAEGGELSARSSAENSPLRAPVEAISAENSPLRAPVEASSAENSPLRATLLAGKRRVALSSSSASSFASGGGGTSPPLKRRAVPSSSSSAASCASGGGVVSPSKRRTTGIRRRPRQLVLQSDSDDSVAEAADEEALAREAEEAARREAAEKAAASEAEDDDTLPASGPRLRSRRGRHIRKAKRSARRNAKAAACFVALATDKAARASARAVQSCQLNLSASMQRGSVTATAAVTEVVVNVCLSRLYAGDKVFVALPNQGGIVAPSGMWVTLPPCTALGPFFRMKLPPRAADCGEGANAQRPRVLVAVAALSPTVLETGKDNQRRTFWVQNSTDGAVGRVSSRQQVNAVRLAVGRGNVELRRPDGTRLFAPLKGAMTVGAALTVDGEGLKPLTADRRGDMCVFLEPFYPRHLSIKDRQRIADAIRQHQPHLLTQEEANSMYTRYLDKTSASLRSTPSSSLLLG